MYLLIEYKASSFEAKFKSRVCRNLNDNSCLRKSSKTSAEVGQIPFIF